MSTLRQACAVIVLSLAFTVSASAGDIQNPGVASTSSPSTTATVILTIVSLLIYR